MPNWSEAHKIRIEAARKQVASAVAIVNREMANLPPRFKIVANDEGRDITLIEDGVDTDVEQS